MSILKVHKLTALPGSLEKDSIYFISDASNAALMEIYVTDTAGTAHRHTPTKSEIETLINSKLSQKSSLKIVDNIAARDLLTGADKLGEVHVKDASADNTVTSGSAGYIWDASGNTWIKIRESESMDVVQTWANIADKPTSSATAIDDAVTKAHTHANKTQLDKIGENATGDVTYNGKVIKTEWSDTAW